jgi:DNA-binding GntR family transcriptional regulator
MGGTGSTATTEIADRLRQDIVSGALGLGTRVTLEALAGRYACGHMPVREALRQLAGEGLVELPPNRGARIRRVDVAFVHNLFEVRIAIEALLARRCAERIDTAGIVALEAAEAGYEALAERGEFGMLVGANRAFHDIMNRAARNPEATATLDRHWQLIAALWARFGYGAERVPGVIADHRQIILAMRTRDAEVASCLAMAHAAKAKQELLARMTATTLADVA